MEITGRRLRLSAVTQVRLGQALAVVLADGVVLDTYRSSDGRLDHLLRPTPDRVGQAFLPVPG